MSSLITRPLVRAPILKAHSQPIGILSTVYSLHRYTPQSRAVNIIGTRSVASSVSHRPGSQTLPHALQNIKEETGNSASDLAKTIAGNVHFIEALTPKKDTFIGITSMVASNVPKHILTMGLAGALPYLGTSLSTIYLAREASLAASGAIMNVDPTAALDLLQSCLHVQVTYGAILISFSAALHWGFEFAGYNGIKGYPRLFLGAVPVVYAWSTLALDPLLALVAQWVGYTGLWFVDMKATSAGWTPTWYSQYRFYLTLLVGSCIVSTVTATSYFGPMPGNDVIHHKLEMLRAKRRIERGDFATEVPGEVEAVPAGDLDDAYVRIKKKETHAENTEHH